MPKSLTPKVLDSRPEVNEQLIRQYASDRIRQQELTDAQFRVVEFIRRNGFYTDIRQVCREFDPTHSVTEWFKDEITPLGGETKIKDHKPAFVLDTRGLVSKARSGAPGYSFEIKFGIERRVQIVATICSNIKLKEEYLLVHLTSIDGRTHEPTWDDTVVNPTGKELVKWLRIQIKTSGIKALTLVSAPDWHTPATESFEPVVGGHYPHASFTTDF